MADSSDRSHKLEDSGAIEVTGKIMVVAIIVLFLVVVFVFFLHLYAKWYLYRRAGDSANVPARSRRRRFDFATGHQEVAAMTCLRPGLDPSVLKSIPVVVFSAKEFPDGLECAVCLCEVSEGEKARLLPKCDHGFHVDCIDMWFQSHSTCPLCRSPVSSQSSKSSSPESTHETILQIPIEENSTVGVYSTEAPNFPTNVLFWGNDTQISTLGTCLDLEEREGHQSQVATCSSQPPPCASSSSSSSSTSCNRPDGTLVIDIPRQGNEEEESKSPMTTRLRSLKRLLSRNSRVSPRSGSTIDAEQAQAGRGQC